MARTVRVRRSYCTLGEVAALVEAAGRGAVPRRSVCTLWRSDGGLARCCAAGQVCDIADPGGVEQVIGWFDFPDHSRLALRIEPDGTGCVVELSAEPGQARVGDGASIEVGGSDSGTGGTALARMEAVRSLAEHGRDAWMIRCWLGLARTPILVGLAVLSYAGLVAALAVGLVTGMVVGSWALAAFVVAMVILFGPAWLARPPHRPSGWLIPDTAVRPARWSGIISLIATIAILAPTVTWVMTHLR